MSWIIYFLLGICWIIILIDVVAFFKNENTFRNRSKILDAIHSYQMHLLNLGIYDHTDLYSYMESYDSTFRRFWDWGYTRILPPNYFKLIEPFIER